MSEDAGRAPVVQGAVIATAWRTVQVLDGPTAIESTSTDELRQAVARHGPGEIARGLIVVVAALLQTVAAPEPHPSPGEVDGQDPLSVVLPALLRQLRRGFPEVAASAVPTLAAVVTAALTGQDAVAWHDRHGEASLPELAGLTCLLWLVRDLVDASYERPGTADELVAEVFTSEA